MACVKYLLTQYRYARMSAKERHQLVQQLLKSIPRLTRRVAMHLANRNPDYQVQYMSVALGAVIPDKKHQALIRSFYEHTKSLQLYAKRR